MSDTEVRGSPDARGRPSTSYTGVGTDEDLADRLSELARQLQDEDDVQATLDAIVHGAATTVPGAEQASLSVIQGHERVSTRASTAELPRAVDRAQYDSGQGPCLDTLYEQRTVRLSDTRHEQRWPDFTRRARALGVGSMLAVQLYVDGGDLGALNLFSTDRDAFGDDAEHIALLFASHAAVAMAGAQRQEQLRQGLDTRDLIGQAKGILMERYKISGDAAFRVLVRYSQNSNRRLHLVAEQLVTSRELPLAAVGADAVGAYAVGADVVAAAGVGEAVVGEGVRKPA